MMKELKDYTDDELRQELKRRAIEKRRNTPKKIEYVEFEATVDSIDGYRENYIGTRFNKPFTLWSYRVKDCSYEFANQYLWKSYKLFPGKFNKSNSPKVGDRVRLRYRKTKNPHEVFMLSRAKIIEILK